jgi:nucleoside-diphosphate-sugar epimerase
MISAIVTGATGKATNGPIDVIFSVHEPLANIYIIGITGNAIVRHLLKNPSYSKIYTLSRSQPGVQDARIEHTCLDLQGSAEEMAKGLAGVSAEYIYFCAYLARDDNDEAARVNGALLSNFIKALEITGAAKKLKRLILTCGFKHYGVHLGLPKQPLVESDPRLVDSLGGHKWPSNFYYTQQDILREAAARGNWEWICTLPNDVIGYAKNNFMNEATALALYAAVSKALPGSQLIYPGNKLNYFINSCWTSAELHAQFCLWAATAPGTGNNVFNVTNGDTESFQSLWPLLAERFGCTIPENMFDPATTERFKNEATSTELENSHPISVQAKAMGIADDAVNSRAPTLQLPIDPEKWAQRKDVKEAWNNLKVKYDLDQAAWDKATWDFLTFVLGREWGCVASMSKARKLGWTGYEDTWEAFERTFNILEKEGIIPPTDKLKKDF